MRSWAVLAGGRASSCRRATHSDRWSRTGEEEEEEREEEGGKPALLSYRRKKGMKWRSGKGEVSEMEERRRDSRR